MGFTKRKYKKYRHEVKRVIRGVVKVTVCCCAAPGDSRRSCAIVAGNKNPCRCYCHDTKCYCGLANCRCQVVAEKGE